MSSNNTGINISGNQGDVIGVGIVGNNNIIIKKTVNINDFIEETYSDCGLTLIHPNYFKENTDTEENVQQWREKGYPLSLGSVYKGEEFRREKTLKDIKYKIDTKKRLLLLGESGTSKTTFLKEIICDYFNDGFRVLYNLGDNELKNPIKITEKIRDMAYGDNKILIVIDDVHSQKSALIFNVIESIAPLNKEKRNNIHFLLAARQPEFGWALERNLFGDYKMVQRIKALFDDNDFKYIVKYFEKEEVKEFIERYDPLLHPLIKNNSIEVNTNAIYKDTQGHPIMVRFLVLNQGLTVHVEQMYFEYLLDKNNNNYPHIQRLKVVFLISLFDISSIFLVDEILKDLDLLSIAKRDLQDTIIKKNGKVWKTIHPKWDLELLKLIFSLKFSSEDVVDSFSSIMTGIIKSKKINNIDKLLLLNTVYSTFTNEGIIQLDMIKDIIEIENVEQQLDDDSRYIYFSMIVGFSYYSKKR